MNKKASTTNNTRAHVLKRDSGWAVKKEGTSRASRIYDTQVEAIKEARKLTITGHDVVIHKKDGSILKWEKSKK